MADRADEVVIDEVVIDEVVIDEVVIDEVVIDEVVIAINNALGLDERDERAVKRLAHTLKWYSSAAARAPRRVEVTLTGRLAFDDFDNMSLTLPEGEEIDLGGVAPNAEGVQIKGLD